MSDTPQLTTEQKLFIRENQVVSFRLREQARQAVEKASQIEQQIVQFINKTATDLAIDPKTHGFDADTLTFVENK